MGMYDTFVIDGECWNCGATIHEWQTKQLECLLSYWEKGDKFKSYGLSIDSGDVHVYNYCSTCDKRIHASVIIKDGRVHDIIVHNEGDLK